MREGPELDNIFVTTKQYRMLATMPLSILLFISGSGVDRYFFMPFHITCCKIHV